MNHNPTKFREWQVRLEAEVAGTEGFEWREITVSAGNESFADKIAKGFVSGLYEGTYRNAVVEYRDVEKIVSEWKAASV